MSELIKPILDSANSLMEKSVHHLESELLKLRAGKANPVMLESVTVDAYGSAMPISQLGSVTAQDARSLVVDPYDKSLVHAIEKAIRESGLGLNPLVEGKTIRVPIPSLTEERRKELVKKAKDEGETAKVAIRNIRREHNDQLKKLKDKGISEDDIKSAEGVIQKYTDETSHKVDEVLRMKEKEIMTI